MKYDSNSLIAMIDSIQKNEILSETDLSYLLGFACGKLHSNDEDERRIAKMFVTIHDSLYKTFKNEQQHQ